ncbi:type I polyketide synthase [Streptomyces sp. ML-6]|uniref:type I polyketide synthase n=1 Tax=Streptomyces sp. ML-6 TaxID=2982693 RepID=UPI0024C08FE3|nr:type I polyketide synthase [Streptomyces sp. ML-6]MDK0524709.1 SDR family NAD(P)-dependent oxidoreductase [Streptomyces sp. ML-6]
MAENTTGPEDIAVVGMACRYPGGMNTPEQLWAMVDEGRDAITDFPDNREWHTEDLYDPSFVRQGGFLHDADVFDAEFFGIRPAEAISMDPQQRVLLQVAWEAVERAGIVPSSLKGSRTGVFVGLMPNEYGMPLWKWQDTTAGFMGTGTSPSVASGRIAYLLGLEGPALTIDTACSSSGVAIHTAVRSLRSGETDLALTGGCTVLTGPGMFVDYAKKGALSPDGRCRTFSDTANGTVWAEGAGVLVLERLSEARRNGRRILGVIKGTAVNQDGASNGLTAPSGRAQVKVIQQALADARLAPGAIQLVEAHGTATKLGDPIEANAIQATYGADRGDEPVWIGSFKSNVGHTMAAAGVGGVIKCLSAMRAGTMPKTLHVENLNSHVDWSSSVNVLRESRPWPAETDGRRRCAVSSFGVSGTNSHVILESWQEESTAPTPPADTSDHETQVLTLSARTPAALRLHATRIAAHLTSGTSSVAATAQTLATRREHYPHRAVAVAGGRENLAAALRAFADDTDSPEVMHAEARRIRRPVFVFPGQGSQWDAMAVQLLKSSDVFRLRVEEVAGAFKPYLDYDVLAVLRGEDRETDRERTDVVQPLIFTMMLGLASMWGLAGVRPAAVVGHSQGEVAAACLAGALSLDGAARVVACRSRILENEGRGGMVAVALDAEEAVTATREADARLTVAAINGPAFTILSGDDEPGVRRLLDQCEDRDVYARRVPAKCASHSPVMAELEGPIKAGLDNLQTSAEDVTFFSTVEGDRVRGQDLTAAYWYRNLREPVRFAETVATMVSHGYDAFIEISPHPVLLTSLHQILEQAGSDAPVCATLRRDQGSYERFLTAAAEAHVQGHDIDWAALHTGTWSGAPVPEDLPTYPFAGRRFWLPSQMDAMAAPAPTTVRPSPDRTRISAGGHPFLTSVLETVDGTTVLSGRLSVRSHPWLLDHRVEDTPLLPGTAFAELLLSAGRELDCPALDEMVLRDPLLLPVDGARVEVQVTARPADEQGQRAVAVYSRPTAGTEWRQHAEGLVSPGTERPTPAGLPAGPGAGRLETGTLYSRLRERGYGYGDAFQGVREGEHGDGWSRSRVVLPDSARIDHSGFALHPALSDAALHAAVACGLIDTPEAGDIAVPFVFNGVRTGDRDDADQCWAVARRVAPDAIALTLTDDDGHVLLSVDRMVVRGLERPARQPERDEAGLYTTDWAEAEGEPGAKRRLCVVGADGPLAPSLRATAHDGITVATLGEAVMVVRALPGDWQVVLAAPSTGSGTAAHVHDTAEWTLKAVQQWMLAEDLAGRAQLTFVTRNSVAVPGDDAHDLASAALWGMVRTAQTETPGHIRVIDVDDAAVAGPGPIEAALQRSEAQLAVRAGRVLRPYLWPHAPVADAFPDCGDGTVVITGGTGTIGRALARHLVTRRSVRSVALLSRSGRQAPGIAAVTSELERLGASVRVCEADVTDAERLRTILAELRTERPLAGVVHAAGLLDDAIVPNMTPGQLRRVLASKVDSALALDAATREDDLRFFTVFSSLYGVLGGPGQANYAAANTFLDHFAQWRRARGRPANSVAWGLWDEATGMTGHLNEADLLRLRRNGVAPFTVPEGLALFDAALSSGTTAVTAARLAVSDTAEDGPFLFSRLAEIEAARTGKARTGKARTPTPTVVPPVPVPQELRETRETREPRETCKTHEKQMTQQAHEKQVTRQAQEAQGAPTVSAQPRAGAARPTRPQETAAILDLLNSAEASHDQRVAGLLAVVKESVAELLGTEPRRVDAQQSFYEMGFDSLTSMELRVRLGRRLDIRLGATVVFDHPTPEALVSHVVELFRPDDGQESDDSEESDPGRVTEPGSAPAPAADEPSAPDFAPFPLTKLQEAYLAGRAGDFELGNVSTYLYVEVDLTDFDVAAAGRALDRLVRRHPMLRAVFDPKSGSQRVLGTVPRVSIPVENLTRLTEDEREKRLAAIHTELKAKEFDVTTWPLFMVRATVISPTVTRLHFGIDVLVSDGSSTSVLFREWAQLHEAPDRELPELRSGFDQFVLGMREQATTAESGRSRLYWEDRLPSLPPAPELPLAVRLADVRRPVFTNRFVRIEAPDWERFRRNAAAAGLTASGAVLGAYCHVLAAWSKTPDFTVTCLVSQRDAPAGVDTSNVMGNFSSTSLLEVHVDQAAPFRDTARRIQRRLMQDMEHTAHSGLDVLRDLGRRDASAGRARMPVVFNSTIGGAPAGGRETGPVGWLCRMGKTGTPVWSGVRTPQVILDHTAFEENGGLILNWDVVEEVFPEGVVDGMFAAYERLIRELCR